MFNVLLLVAALPVAWSGIFDTTTTAFVLISIECDLGATSFRKGVLASIPFLGRVPPADRWGAPRVARHGHAMRVMRYAIIACH